MNKSVKNLEEKPWYRLLKVIYIAGFIFAVGFVLLNAYKNIPYTNIDGLRFFCAAEGATNVSFDQLESETYKLSDVTNVTGNKTKMVPIIDHSISSFCQKTFGHLNYKYSVYKNYQPTQQKYVIAPVGDGKGIFSYVIIYDQKNFNYQAYTLYKFKNGSVSDIGSKPSELQNNLQENTSGSWKLSIYSLIIGLAIIFVGFEIIKRIFYYIVLGTIKPNK
jgi:hypothetical protein